MKPRRVGVSNTEGRFVVVGSSELICGMKPGMINPADYTHTHTHTLWINTHSQLTGRTGPVKLPVQILLQRLVFKLSPEQKVAFFSSVLFK